MNPNTFMGQVMKCFDLTIDNKQVEDSTDKLWYVGDPCYVVENKDWDLFCQKTWADDARANAENNGHMDSIIEWEGERLEIWSNGGDGVWGFNFEGKSIPLNGFTAEFGVDAGIFCVMPVEICKPLDIEELLSLGIIFKGKRPELYVEDNIVYINDVADNSREECWNCDEMIMEHDRMWCDTGNCCGCHSCFECECEEE